MTRKPKRLGPVAVPRRDDLDPIWPKNIEPETVSTAIVQTVEHGRPRHLCDIFDRVRRQDLVLKGIIKSRLQATQRAPWQIVPDPKADDADKAKQAAAYCREQFAKAGGVGEFLSHNLEATVYGVSVTEMVWEATQAGHRVKAFIPVRHRSLFGHSTDPWRLVVSTHEHDTIGTPLTEWPGKFVTHCPEQVGNSPWGSGLFVAAALTATLKVFSVRWFAAYVEKFGSPFVWAQYGDTATTGDVARMATHLKNFGHDGFGMGPQSWKLQFIESMRNAADLPQVAMSDRLDKAFAIGILGQELTTQTSPTGGGAFALGKIHERVRRDITDADAKYEATTIQRQVFRPMLDLAGMPDAPTPLFQRVRPEAVDREAEGAVLDTATNRLGLKVTNATAYARLQIPMPDGVVGDDFLEPPEQSAPIQFGNPVDEMAQIAMARAGRRKGPLKAAPGMVLRRPGQKKPVRLADGWD